MYTRWFTYTTASALLACSVCWGQAAPATASSGANNAQVAAGSVPREEILVKGAWWSASDSVTPLPETGKITENVYRNAYFGISWTLPKDWIQKYEGPPPSDMGRYVLTQIVPSGTYTGPRGSVLFTADDLFFTPFPVTRGEQLVDFSKDNLQQVYKVEQPPTEMKIGGRSFRSFAYWAPAAKLHWFVFATQIRCHAVEIVVSSSDPKLIQDLIQDLNSITLPPEDALADGDAVPVCVKDYATADNVINRVNPVFSERRYNAIPVRIVIGKDGKVKHIHFIRAFPDQVKIIGDALNQWTFKPYLKDGRPVEVETGIQFGTVARAQQPSTTAKARPPSW